MAAKWDAKKIIPGWDPRKRFPDFNALRTVYKMQGVHAQRAARGPKRRGGRRK